MISESLSRYVDWAMAQHGEYYKKKREAEIFLLGLRTELGYALEDYYKNSMGDTAQAYDGNLHPVEAIIVDVKKSDWDATVGVKITVLFNPDDMTSGLSLTEKEKQLVAKLKKVYQEAKARPRSFSQFKDDYYSLEILKNGLALCKEFRYTWFDEDLAQGSFYPYDLDMKFWSGKREYKLQFSDFKETKK